MQSECVVYDFDNLIEARHAQFALERSAERFVRHYEAYEEVLRRGCEPEFVVTIAGMVQEYREVYVATREHYETYRKQGVTR